MKNLFSFSAFLFLAFQIIAQSTPPSIQWQKSFGGSYHDEAKCIRQTTDGGFIIAGYSYSNDGDVSGNHDTTGIKSDDWIVKIDSSGNIQWQKCYGGTNVEVANSIQQTKDGGYILAGHSSSNDGDVTGNHGGYDYWIVKIDSSGNIQWQKTLGGTGAENAYSIQQTPDGEYLVAGFSSSNDGDVTGHHGTSGYDDWIVKLDTSGNIQWQKSFGGTKIDVAHSIILTTDGGCIFAGYSYSNNGDVTANHDTTGNSGDYWIVKTDLSGNIHWRKCLGGTFDDAAYSIQQTIDGGYIVGGYTSSNDGDVSGNHAGIGGSTYYEYWIAKLDTSGNMQWQKCLGGTSGDVCFSLEKTTDGGYIMAGFTGSTDGDVTGYHNPNSGFSDYWIVKLDSTGNFQWQKCLGGTELEIANSIQQTTDGGYIVAGFSRSIDGDVTVNHNTILNYNDYWIVKLGPAPLSIKEQKITSDISIYPNPSKGVFTVQVPKQTIYVEILNSFDQLEERRIVKNQTEMNFVIKNEGFYFVRIVTDKKTITEKVVISK